jgi:hypothetical protein
MANINLNWLRNNIETLTYVKLQKLTYEKIGLWADDPEDGMISDWSIVALTGNVMRGEYEGTVAIYYAGDKFVGEFHTRDLANL